MSQAVTTHPHGMTPEEWQTRCDLAALYRLVAHYGWDDFTGTHISARVPGTDHFLLNPFGMLFEEITASALIKVDQDGKLLSESEYPINPAGFTIHSAIHMAKPELHWVLHTHTIAGNAVAMQRDGLLPLHQKALTIMGFLCYHDYEGAALDHDERERIVADLGDENRIMVLRNHGLLTVGETPGEAFSWMYRIETACRYQVAGLAGNQPLRHLSDNVQKHAIEQGKRIFGKNGFAPQEKNWSMLLRQLERHHGTDYRQ